MPTPTVIDFVWNRGLEFTARTGRIDLIVDSSGLAGPSPVEALAVALGGCMAIDLADILAKGRHAFSGLQAKLVAQRAADYPHRFVSVTLHFDVHGDVRHGAVERALSLSRDTYCSVWHSLRQDILFQVTFDVVP